MPARTTAIIPANFNPIKSILAAPMTMINATAGKEMYQYVKKAIIAITKERIQRENCSIKIFPFYPPFYNFLGYFQPYFSCLPYDSYHSLKLNYNMIYRFV